MITVNQQLAKGVAGRAPVDPDRAIRAKAVTQALERLVQKLKISAHAPGDCLLTAGSDSQELVVLKEGLAVASAKLPMGPLVPVKFLARGCCLYPDNSVARPIGLSLVALSPVTRLTLPLTDLFGICRDWPEFACAFVIPELLRSHTERLTVTRRMSMPLEVRLAQLLWELGQPLSETNRSLGRDLERRIPQSTLAAFFRVPREEVSRKLGRLEHAGLLTKNGRGYLLSQELPALVLVHGVPFPPPDQLAAMLLTAVTAGEATRRPLSKKTGLCEPGFQ